LGYKEFISLLSQHVKVQRKHVESGHSGTDYTFPVENTKLQTGRNNSDCIKDS